MLALKKPLIDSGWRNIARKVPAGCVLSLPGLPEGRSQARIPDISGNNNHGAITGATWDRLPTGMDGVLSFDGTDDKIVVADSASIRVQAMTLEIWAEFSATIAANQGFFFNKGFAPNAGFDFRRGNGGLDNQLILDLWRGGAASSSVGATGLLSAGRGWTHLRATWDRTVNSGKPRLYINDVEITYAANVALLADISYDATDLSIGGVTGWHKGHLALPRVFNSVVASHFNQERSLFNV